MHRCAVREAAQGQFVASEVVDGELQVRVIACAR